MENDVAITDQTKKTILSSKYIWIILAGIILITCFVYFPISNNNFINWDDNGYVYENNQIQKIDKENVKAWFSNSYVATYLPITMFSYAIDYQIDQLNPKVYIITNLILHIFNTAFVFYFILLILLSIQNEPIINSLSNRDKYLTAAFTSVLFAVHPICVESVAWVAERKNLLFTFFFLLSLISYIKYLTLNKKLYYVLSIILFVLSLLSKGVAVSLSLCAVLLDYLYQRKLFSRKVILEKIPFFLLSVIFGIVVLIFQQNEYAENDTTVLYQIVYAFFGLFSYLYKLAVPFDLLPFYSYPHYPQFVHWLFFTLSIILISVIVIFRKRLTPLLIFAILFFVANLIFLLQFIPIGEAIMADRYIYLSSIGFFLAASVIITKYVPKAYLLFLLLIVSYAFTTRYQIKIWNNSLVFWDAIIEKNPEFSSAWLNRGSSKDMADDYQGAIVDFNEAIKLKPSYKAFYNRGLAKAKLQDFEGAINDFSTALTYNNKNSDIWEKRAIAKQIIHDFEGAINDYNELIKLSPYNKQAYNNRGIMLLKLGKTEDALSDFSKAILLDPNFEEPYLNRASLLKASKKYKEALADLDQVINLDPKLFSAYSLRAVIRLRLGDIDGSLNDCNLALQLNNKKLQVYLTQCAALYKSGKYNEVINNINLLLGNNSKIGILYYLRGLAEIKSGNSREGTNDFSTAKKLGFVASENEITKEILR